MNDLDRLLEAYVPPAVPQGLAARAAAAAIQVPQEKAKLRLPWRRGDRRGGWKRPVLIGSAVIGLAFTSAVAAEVASGGRIEIPVVHEVVAAIPALSASPRAQDRPVQLASVEKPQAKRAPPAAVPRPEAEPAAPTAREQAVERFAKMKHRAEERRAAGLPTPNADRIERKAQRIIERREAAGLPTPSLDEVEMRLAVRQWRTARMLRQVARDPASISDGQVQRFARILPPPKREQFLALGPEQQRQLMTRAAQRFLARRARVQMQAGNESPPSAAERF